jgi:hypothetical protein
MRTRQHGSCGSRLIDGLLALLLLGLIGAILFPVFAQSRDHPHRSPCLSNVKQLATGQLIYTCDWEDRLPQAVSWMDKIKPYVKDERVFHCPIAQAKDANAYGYAMSVACSDVNTVKAPTPDGTVLLFESALLARNACSGFYGLPDPPRHETVDMVAFVDGHAMGLIAERLAEYGPDGRKKQ